MRVQRYTNPLFTSYCSAINNIFLILHLYISIEKNKNLIMYGLYNRWLSYLLGYTRIETLHPVLLYKINHEASRNLRKLSSKIRLIVQKKGILMKKGMQKSPPFHYIPSINKPKL